MSELEGFDLERARTDAAYRRANFSAWVTAEAALQDSEKQAASDERHAGVNVEAAAQLEVEIAAQTDRADEREAERRKAHVAKFAEAAQHVRRLP